MVMSFAGLGIKNVHAGEDQQQFARPTDHAKSRQHYRRRIDVSELN
jgi:hypothetical protein